MLATWAWTNAEKLSIIWLHVWLHIPGCFCMSLNINLPIKCCLGFDFAWDHRIQMNQTKLWWYKEIRELNSTNIWCCSKILQIVCVCVDRLKTCKTSNFRGMLGFIVVSIQRRHHNATCDMDWGRSIHVPAFLVFGKLLFLILIMESCTAWRHQVCLSLVDVCYPYCPRKVATEPGTTRATPFLLGR